MISLSQSLEQCNVELPDTVRLIKFTDVVALGEKHPTNLSKIKCVKYKWWYIHVLHYVYITLCRHKPTDIYSVQFTSGSTGDPKGCVFQRGTWKNRIAKVLRH